MSLRRRIERKRALAEVKQIRRDREQLGATTIKAIALIQQSPLINRQNFAVDLFKEDTLADRINTAWLIIKGKSDVRCEMEDEHAEGL